MQVKHFKEPFYHTIIYDYFSPSELSEVWQEIDELQQYCKDTRDEGDPRAMNMTSVHLDKHFVANRGKSKILTHNRKIFNLEEELKENIFSQFIWQSNFDVTQLNMYENGLYHGHRDSAVMSAVSLFYKEPKPYKGGELVFPEHRYTPNIVNNSTMIFPSFELHAVNPVQGPGRFSLNQFFFVNIS